MTEIDLIVNQFILEQGKLYTLPELYHQLQKKINSNTANIDDISKIISTDATLSAKILKIANSPLYGFRAQISTLSRALSLIGINEIKNLILIDSLSDNFNNSDQCKYINMENFWRRSVYLALISKRLAKRLRHPDEDRIFISAIMSRLGQLVCCSTHTKEVELVIGKYQAHPEIKEFSFEKDRFNFNYNEVSAKILAHWSVPEEITLSLKYLHDPQNAPDDIKANYLAELSILHTATIYSGILERDNLNTQVNEGGIPSVEPSESYLARIDPAINQFLNIDQKVIDDILFEIEMDALEILSIIFPDSTQAS